MSALDVLVVALAAGVGTALRWRVLRSVAARGVTGGVAWVNVPAGVVAGAALALPWGHWPVLAVVGVCSGLSTYSSLALELATAVRARDRRGLVMSLAGTALGLAAGLGSAAVVSAVTSR